MRKCLFAILLGMSVMACQKDKSEVWQPLDLMPKAQIPITLLAPDSTEISSFKVGMLKDISVVSLGKEKFSIQIYASQASTSDLSQLKANQIQEVKSNPQFVKIIHEDLKGFIYAWKSDSALRFSFRYVYLQGDQEVVFTTGLTEGFTLSEVDKMYHAVQQKQ
jgi:hypothetical protein